MLQDVPTVLGARYRVVERLGRGGMADVYRAEDLVLRRTVAVKVFRGGVEREQHLARFRAEVRTLARLTHPHLVALYDAGGDVAEPWCAMEYIDGGSLADRDAALPPRAVARVGQDVATALVYVHEQGIVHRDVKPSNVLLAAEGGAFLSDFGIAKLVDGTRMTQSGLMIGTAAFLSPEQVRGETAVCHSDIYALGLVLLEALTGEREYPGSPVESAVARLSRPPRVPARLGGDWVALLTEMTAEAVDDRPDAEDVARRLARLVRTGTGPIALPAFARPASSTGEGGSFGRPSEDPVHETPSAGGGSAANIPAQAIREALAADDDALLDDAPLDDPADVDVEVVLRADAARTDAGHPADASADAAPADAVASGGAGRPGAEPAGADRPGTGPSSEGGPGGDAVPAAPGLEGLVVPLTVNGPRRPDGLGGWLSRERRRSVATFLAGGGVAAGLLLGVPLLEGGMGARVVTTADREAAATTASAPAQSAASPSAQLFASAPLDDVEPAPRPAPQPVAYRQPAPAAGHVSDVSRSSTPSVTPSPSPSPSTTSPSPSSGSPTGSTTVTPSTTPSANPGQTSSSSTSGATATGGSGTDGGPADGTTATPTPTAPIP